MEPFLKQGSFVLANPFAFLFSNPKIGDIVFARHPQGNRLLIKRVMRVRKENRTLYFWIEGDNASRSVDSRNFGWVEQKLVVGKPLCGIMKK